MPVMEPLCDSGGYLSQSDPRTSSTIAHPNVLAVHADVPEEDGLRDHPQPSGRICGALHEIHKATREVTVENALTGLIVPLHPGAIRYYREVGIAIPPELIPDE